LAAAGPTLATAGPITPAAGIVVFVAIAGHECSRLGVQLGCKGQPVVRALLAARLTQNRHPLLLKAKLVAGFFR
ncbi:hypothetical protein, partial [Bradyrhizobium oropedii]|uniref:hypothetical protein n=1 Tax=Bradyrhizobium oropedii TaxID=1571201 RepID=UPI001E587137